MPPHEGRRDPLEKRSRLDVETERYLKEFQDIDSSLSARHHADVRRRLSQTLGEFKLGNAGLQPRLNEHLPNGRVVLAKNRVRAPETL